MLFAAKVAKPQTHAAASATKSLAFQRSTRLEHRAATEKLDRVAAQDHDGSAGSGLSWDFSTIPAVTPDRANRPLSAPRSAGSIGTMLQRDWSDAPVGPLGGAKSAVTTAPSYGWNRGEVQVGNVRRIPVEGLTQGNKAPDKNAAAQEAAESRAIVIVPDGVDLTRPVEVLLHMHGHNVGYRQRTTKGADPSAIVGSVRDVDTDQIERQLQASGRQMIGVLPQGTTMSGFGATFNSDTYLKDVFGRLAQMGIWGQSPAPSIRSVVLTGHSGASRPISEMMTRAGHSNLPSNLGEVALFDAINGKTQQDIIVAWVLDRLQLDLMALTAPYITEAQQLKYLATSLRFRGYFSTGYVQEYQPLVDGVTKWFHRNESILGGTSSPIYAALRANYKVDPVGHGAHDRVLSIGNKLQDALTALPSSRAATASAGADLERDADGAHGRSHVVPSSVHEVLASTGEQLAREARALFEAGFNYDFSRVQIHTDSRAAKSARAVDARAYTVGHHIVFDTGLYQPNSQAGQHLLAHELTHVVQQGGGLPDTTQLRISDPGDAHEEIAASTADRMVGNGREHGPRNDLVRPAVAGLQRQQATAENVSPIRADESGKTTTTYDFGQFSIFIPKRVTFGSGLEDRNPKVHIFFAAGGVQGLDTNDIALHGLRGSSDASLWVTIGVPGISGGANTISDAQIRDCLKSVGIGPPSVVRLTGHSRGCDSLMATLVGKRITTPIDRVIFLDEAVEHVASNQKLPDGSPDPAAGSVRVNRVQALVGTGVPADKITSYEPTNKSRNTVTGASAHVAGARYIDLNSSAMAAIGAARLVQDAMALDPAIAARANANQRIVAQLRALNLPPRGTFTTGPTSAARTNITEFCLEPVSPGAPGAPRTLKASITAITKDPVLVNFIDHNNLARYSTVHGWAGLAAHEFFVAEIAHELTE